MPGAADVPGAPPPGPFDKDASFEALARTTGGKSLYSRNDVDREIGESVRDGETITRSLTVLLLLPATASRSEQLESRWQSRLCMRPTARGTSTRSPRRPRSPARALSTTWTRRLKAPSYIPASANAPNRNLGLSVPTSSIFRKRNWCGLRAGAGICETTTHCGCAR